MATIKELQKRVYQNKINKGFNVKDLKLELLLILEELAEFSEAIRKEKQEEIMQELADLTIYCLGFAEILGMDLEKEVQKKMDVNENRQYIREGDGWTKI